MVFVFTIIAEASCVRCCEGVQLHFVQCIDGDVCNIDLFGGFFENKLEIY